MTCTAKEAHEYVSKIMDGMKKKAVDYIFEFNEVLMYLESKQKEELK